VYKNADEYWLKEVNCLKDTMSICSKVGILCYKDSFIVDKNGKKEFVIVTPYLEDYITLNDYIYYDVFEKDDAKDIYKKVVDVKNALTELCINHSDLHTGNIMIHPDTKDIKVIDLGRCQTPQQEIDEWEYYPDKWKINSDDARLSRLRKSLFDNLRFNKKINKDLKFEIFDNMLKDYAPIELYTPGCERGGEIIKDPTDVTIYGEIVYLQELLDLTDSPKERKTIMKSMYDYFIQNKKGLDEGEYKEYIFEIFEEIMQKDIESYIFV
jgi:serine/threonine protein kinase